MLAAKGNTKGRCSLERIAFGTESPKIAFSLHENNIFRTIKLATTKKESLHVEKRRE